MQLLCRRLNSDYVAKDEALVPNLIEQSHLGGWSWSFMFVHVLRLVWSLDSTRRPLAHRRRSGVHRAMIRSMQVLR